MIILCSRDLYKFSGWKAEQSCLLFVMHVIYELPHTYTCNHHNNVVNLLFKGHMVEIRTITLIRTLVLVS